MTKYEMKVYLAGNREPIAGHDVSEETIDNLLHAINKGNQRMYILADGIWVNTQYVAAVVCKERAEEHGK